MPDTVDTRARLAKEDPEFKRLLHKHKEYEKRLDELNAQRYLSDAEQYEESDLKKRKLALKDRMEVFIRQAEA